MLLNCCWSSTDQNVSSSCRDGTTAAGCLSGARTPPSSSDRCGRRLRKKFPAGRGGGWVAVVGRPGGESVRRISGWTLKASKAAVSGGRLRAVLESRG
ncbi:hypothetical protein PAHAL_4G343800 [Panicum hallii]|uniref:Uncharacterized protein n=1 Tax=Panicum hallii TaxID=206008 RepID=A0A2T8JF01_9POAL|nr:hypothetical protein PAHAL_4G343800 [Panicum hallii]